MGTTAWMVWLAVVAAAGAAPAAEVYAVSATAKVGPQQAVAPTWSPAALSLQCARNEWEAAQVVVRGGQALGDVSVELTDLRGPQDAVLPASLARWYRVEWVDINAPYEVDRPSLKPDWRADPLMPIQPGERCALTADRNLVFWLAVHVPESARPGTYTGQVRVSLSGTTVKTLAVSLLVRRFALPRTPLLRSLIGFSDGNIYKAHGCRTPADKERIIRGYFEEYIRARLSPFLYAPGTMAFNPLPGAAIQWQFVKGADGRPTGAVTLDFTAFDREARHYFDERGAFSAFNFAPYLWIRRNKEVVLRFQDSQGTAVERRRADGSVDPVYDQLVVATFRGVAAHLAERGWLDRAVYYVTDEPSDSDTPAIKTICQLVRQADPRLRTALTYDPASRPRLAELVDDQGQSLISVWIPYCTQYRQQVADEQRRKGADYWLYDVSSTCLIGMSAETNRAIMWDTWRRGCHGYLYYLSTWWGREVTPWDRPSFRLPEYTYRYRQGDGYFFYPPRRKYSPEAPILDTIVPTIRWEMLREGAEDYDYLAMLQELTQRAEQRQLPAAAAGRAALKLAASMSEIMSGVSENHGIRDLQFQPTEGWSFGLEEGWLHGHGGKAVDLPIRLKTTQPDGRYRLVLDVYDDPSYRGQPYSRFRVNGQPYASPGGGLKGAVLVPTEEVTVKNGQCQFTLSSVADQTGVIVYHVGLQRLAQGETADPYAVRAQVADAIERLQAALPQ